MSDTAVDITSVPGPSVGQQLCLIPARAIQLLIFSPPIIFVACLCAMLFRPPDLDYYPIDRVALVALFISVGLRSLVLGKPLRIPALVTLPLGGLLLLSFSSLVSQPFEAANWSVWVAKWAVPFAFYPIAGFVFDNPQHVQILETFLLLVLGYLILIALFFLLDLKALIFPHFIIDEALGIHADRARGPFLQAVANGVTINLLGLIAIDAFRRRRLYGIWAAILLAGLPIAIFATMTRAVWLCFAASVAVLVFSANRRVRRAVWCFAFAGCVAALLLLACSSNSCRYGERFEERGPVDFRVVMFQTGVEMFQEKPWTGWRAADVQPELAKRVVDFYQRQYFFHNNYLEIAVYHGVIGLALYAWLIVDLFRLGSSGTRRRPPATESFADRQFCRIWPIMLGVYLVNACFVVMNYQFVNAVLFSVAGLLAARRCPPSAWQAIGCAPPHSEYGAFL